MLKPAAISHSSRNVYKSVEPTWTESYTAGLHSYVAPLTDTTMEAALFGAQPYDNSFDFGAAIESNPDMQSYAYELAHAKNSEHFDFLAGSLRRNISRREVLSKTTFLTGLTTELLNPLNLLFAFPALGAVGAAVTGAGRVAAAGRAGLVQGAAAGVALETLRYPFDPLQSAAESGFNIAASTAFGGALGAGIPGAFLFAKDVLPDTTRKIMPFIGRAQNDEARWNRGEVNEVEGMPIVEVDNLTDPAAQRVSRTEEIELDDDSVVVYNAVGNPVRASVIRSEDGLIQSFDIGDGVQRTVGEDEYSFTSPYETDKILAPLVRDDGSRPVIADLDDVEIDEAIGFAEDALQTAEGLESFEVQRQLTALKVKKEKLKAPQDPPRPKETRQVNEIVINLDKARSDYETQKFTFPEVEGATALAGNDFRSFDDYRDFLAFKQHRLSTTERGKKTDAEFENEINTLALGDLARAGTDGYSTKSTAFNDHHLFKSPVFRALSNKMMPQGVKRILSLQTGNNQVALNRNTAGFGVNAVDQQMDRGTVKFRKTLDQLQDIWVRDTKGRDSARIYRGIGTNLEEFIPNKTTFNDWFEQQVDIYLMNDGRTLTKNQKETQAQIKGLLDDFLETAQDDGLLLGIENYEVEIKRIREEIEFQQTIVRQYGEGDPKAKLAEERIDELTNGVDGLRAMEDAKRSAQGISHYRWPRYYNVLELRKSFRGDKVYYNELREIIIDEYRKNPIKEYYNDKTQRMEAHVSDPVKDADETLSRIMQDENDPEAYLGIGQKGKHLKRRVLNIPDSKLRKFLVKDVSVLGAYSKKMGFRIAWQRNFGDKTLADIMNDIEVLVNDDPQLKSVSKKKRNDLIAQAQKAFYGDYLRHTGTHVRNPHRWDNQVAKVLTDYAGIVHLAGSGVTAVGDLANMITARSFLDMVNAARLDLDVLFKNVEDVEGFVEVLSMSPNMIKEQLMADSKTGLQPTLAEKITHFPTKIWFNMPIIGNDLHAITSLTRRIASAYNVSDIIELASKIASGKRVSNADLQRAGTLGLDEKAAKYIYSQREHFEKGKKITMANSKRWDTTTKEGREGYEAFLQAIELATDSQIIMAKAFDKPLIVEGVTFVRYHPLMSVFGMKPDPVISRNGRQYARVQSGFLKFPFQFFNYSFGAASSVLGRALDPAQERRLQHIALSVAMGTALLYFQKGERWFEGRSPMDVAMRSVDRSGVASIYGDLVYDSVHMLTATGAVDPDDMPIRGKYRTAPKDIYGPIGPAPTLGYDLFDSAIDYMDNKTTQNAKEFSRNLPRIVVPFMTLDFATLHDLSDTFD